MKSINVHLKIATVSLLAIVLAGLVWLGITFVSRKFGIKLFENNVISTMGLASCILVCQYFVIKKYNNGRFSFDFIGLAFKQNSFKLLFIGIGVGTLMYFSWALILIVMKIVKFKGIGFTFCPVYNVTIGIISALVMSIFASFSEEILCRGIILNQLMQFKGKIFALIISSLIFTMCHTQYYHDFSALLSVFAMAILFGYVYVITGSLYLSIGLHFAVDFFQLISGVSNNFLLFDIKVSDSQLSIYLSDAQLFVILILILVLVLMDIKKIGFNSKI
ncbi:CPBP family intramembrane glutamic endopeptidase [Clostridium gasigenes]|uniref:CPBP family intramembrane glutamic endopeptidase n=1 Tax=Clostridium gasigenes TaxID=94869 RepID=UPI001C0E063D|nr:type II CAAX endopeptidase family protein [Clostridium gasigenes]MBU3105821.1 CPBP family intramembrane metalloprotease [Clostridium gasigenes]